MQPFGIRRNGQVVQPDHLGIPLLDDGLKFIPYPRSSHSGALLRQVGLAAQLDALDAIASIVVKHVNDLPVDRGDPKSLAMGWVPRPRSVTIHMSMPLRRMAPGST